MTDRPSPPHHPEESPSSETAAPVLAPTGDDAAGAGAGAGAGAAAAAAPGSAPSRPARTAARWLVVTVLAVVTVAGLTVAGWLVWRAVDDLRHDPDRAVAGDCLSGSGAPGELRRVECDATDAGWRVAGRQSGLTWDEFQAVPQDQLCPDHPDTELAVWFGEHRDSSAGNLFCLEPLS